MKQQTRSGRSLSVGRACKLLPVLLRLLCLTPLACQANQGETAGPPSIEPGLQKILTAWLDENGQPPREYLAGLFKSHDVVLLGEFHRIGQQEPFVADMVAPLHAAGVAVLATEFLRREDQGAIDGLVSATEWQEDLARRLAFQSYVFWGFQEYIDIYHSVWSLNRSLPPDVPRMRLIGIGNSPDWSFVRSPEDREKGEIMRQVWKGQSEKDWAGAILDAVAKGEKVLVHCGAHHAFTRYRQAIVMDGRFVRFDPDLRCGNYVAEAIGDRAITVLLHAPWNDSTGYGGSLVHPADGAIDAAMFAIGPRPIGFDVAGGPFADLRPRNAVYRHGYPDFRLGQYCDGWIYLGPISSYQGVTAIPGWFHEANLEAARAQNPNPRLRNASLRTLTSALEKDARTAVRLRGLR